MLFPMLPAEWLNLRIVLYFSSEYHNSRQYIIILFCKYFVDNRSEAWIYLFLGKHKWKSYLHGLLFTPSDFGCCFTPKFNGLLIPTS
jgi:hypothetical protein